MHNYELMYIISPTLEAEQIDAMVEKFKALIESNGGVITEIKKWGKRRLAYEINDLREGYYVIVNYQAAPSLAVELERVLKITEGVMRSMIVRKDD
jgi:small subunit ribosomal protein S6